MLLEEATLKNQNDSKKEDSGVQTPTKGRIKSVLGKQLALDSILGSQKKIIDEIESQFEHYNSSTAQKEEELKKIIDNQEGIISSLEKQVKAIQQQAAGQIEQQKAEINKLNLELTNLNS